MQLPTLRPTQLINEALTDLCEQILFLHRRFDLLLTKDPLTTDPNPLIVDLTALNADLVYNSVSSHVYNPPLQSYAQQPTFDSSSKIIYASVNADSTPAYPDLSTPYIIPSAQFRARNKQR